MKLTHQFYQESFIKFLILSVALLGLFRDFFHGRSKENSRLLALIAILMIAGNAGLYLAMRRAKRREAVERLDAMFYPERLPSFEERVRKRKSERYFMEGWVLGGGVLFLTWGRSWVAEGIPVPWIGCFLILLGVLGLLGFNVFYGGPLDLRLDRPKEMPKASDYKNPGFAGKARQNGPK